MPQKIGNRSAAICASIDAVALAHSGNDDIGKYSFFGEVPTQSRKQGEGHDCDDHDGPPLENNNQLTKRRKNDQGGGVGNHCQVLVGVEKERGEEKRGGEKGVNACNCGKGDIGYYVDVEMNGAMARNMEKGKMGW